MQYISTSVNMTCSHFYVVSEPLTCGTSVAYDVIEGSNGVLLSDKSRSC